MTIVDAGQDTLSQHAGTDRAQGHACTVCGQAPAKYTCPRCSRRTCQLECVKAHKAAGCSGERDRAGFVGMHQYGDIGMWRDLAFLREIGDVVGQHGQELAASLARRSKLEQQAQHRQDRSQGRDQHGGHDRPARILDLPQKDLRLRGQLGRRGVEVLFLPREMERHKKNRSNWNPKKQSLFLTVSAIVIDSTGQRRDPVTSHQHSIQSDLKTVLLACTATNTVDLSTQVVLLRLPARPVVFSSTSKEPIVPASESKAQEAIAQALDEEAMAKPLPMPHASLPSRPSWVENAPAPETVPTEPAVNHLEAADPEQTLSTTLAKTHARRYWRVERPCTETLESALCGSVILEWPEFELWPRQMFEDQVRDGSIEIIEKRSYNRNKKHGRAEEAQEADEQPHEEQQRDRGVSTASSDTSSSEGEDDHRNGLVESDTGDDGVGSDIDGSPIHT